MAGGFRRALVIGSSGGIGAAMCQQLTRVGTEVTGLSRSGDGLDVTDADSVAAHLGALDGSFDLIFVATGALEIDAKGPEKALHQLDAAALMAQFRLNAIGPALVLRHVPRLLPRGGRSVVAALSARVGSIGDNGYGGWYGYRASKAALNQILHTAAIELARKHRDNICVALHPGTVATGLTRRYATRHPTVTPEQAAQRLIAVMDDLTPDQSGGFFDYAGRAIPW